MWLVFALVFERCRVVASADTWCCCSGPLSSIAISDDFNMLERDCCTVPSLIKPRISQQDAQLFLF